MQFNFLRFCVRYIILVSSARLVQQLVMLGTEFFQQNGSVNFGAWAAVKCKGKCTFNGIGLRVGGAVSSLLYS